MPPDLAPIPFRPDLFVTRRAAANEQAQIHHWMIERAAGQSSKKALLLFGPPGYGKTWSLEQVANAAAAERTPFFVVGRIDLSEPVSFEWYIRVLRDPVAARLGIAIDANAEALLGNNVVYLARTCRERTNGHPVLVVDELDQAPDPAKVELQVLAPWMRAGGSVIIGLRFNRSFHTAELRNPAWHQMLNLAGFQQVDALEQFQRLAQHHAAAAGAAAEAAVQADVLLKLVELLDPDYRYDLSIPAINHCLWVKHLLGLAAGTAQRLEPAHVYGCIDGWLKRKPPPAGIDQAQQVQYILQMGTWTAEQWSQTDLGDWLKLSRVEAGRFVDSLIDLNIVQVVMVNGNSAYQVIESWRRLLRMNNHLRGIK